MPVIPQSDRTKRQPVLPNPLNPHRLTPNWLRSALSAAPLDLALFPPEVYPCLSRTLWTLVPATIPSDHPRGRRSPRAPSPVSRSIANWLRSAVSARSLRLALFPPKLVAMSAAIYAGGWQPVRFSATAYYGLPAQSKRDSTRCSRRRSRHRSGPMNPFSNLNPLSRLQPRYGFVPLGHGSFGANLEEPLNHLTFRTARSGRLGIARCLAQRGFQTLLVHVMYVFVLVFCEL